MAQFKCDDRFNYPLSAPPVLDQMCYPIGKIKAIGEVMTAMNIDLKDRPFPDVSTESVGALGGNY